MKSIFLCLLFFFCGIFFRYLWIEAEDINIVDAVIVVIFLTGSAFWIFCFIAASSWAIMKFIKRGGRSGK